VSRDEKCAGISVLKKDATNMFEHRLTSEVFPHDRRVVGVISRYQSGQSMGQSESDFKLRCRVAHRTREQDPDKNGRHSSAHS